MRYLLYISFLLLPLLSFGQNNHRVSGQVTDAVTGEPIPNVHVQVIGSFFGTTTDEEGRFQMELKERYPSLKFSHLSYSPLIHETSTPAGQELAIVLHPKTHLLGEVPVLSKGVEKVVENDSITIFDYTFISNKLLLMTYNYDRRDYYLQLNTLDGQDVSRIKIPNRQPYRFFTDCMGNQHLVGRDSSYQLHQGEDKIHLLYPSNRYQFLEAMEPCAAAKGATVYLQAFDDDQHVVWYGFVKKGEKKATQLRKIVDMETLQKLYEYEEFLAFKEASGMSSYDRMDYIDFGNLIFNKPIYAPMFHLKDHIYIFNHPESVIERYAWRSHQADTLSIDYHKNTEFERQIIIDPVTGQPYAVFEKRENFYLKAINLEDGTVSGPVHLKHRFPDKIKVFNGMVYYLYNKTGQKEQFLYRMNGF